MGLNHPRNICRACYNSKQTTREGAVMPKIKLERNRIRGPVWVTVRQLCRDYNHPIPDNMYLSSEKLTEIGEWRFTGYSANGIRVTAYIEFRGDGANVVLSHVGIPGWRARKIPYVIPNVDLAVDEFLRHIGELPAIDTGRE